MSKYRPKLYFAAPLFNEMERDYNTRIVSRIENTFEVFLPQRDGCMMVDLVRGGMSPAEAKMVVFGKDLAAIEACDVLLIVMNGRSVDEGAAFELGMAYTKGKVCWGLKTDIRQLLPIGDNPMIEGALNLTFHSTEELFGYIDGEYRVQTKAKPRRPKARSASSPKLSGSAFKN